jgi:uncharacterized damage-inducible protein DinB
MAVKHDPKERGDMTDLRYPTGKFEWKGSNSPGERKQFIEAIAETPARLRAATIGLSEQQLDTPYREGGWAVRQVVHHVPESHMNAFIRCKWTLTEDNPLIKAYDQDSWAKLPEVRSTPVEASLRLLESLHARWVPLLHSLSEQDWKRTFRHPESGEQPLDRLLAMYAWHGPHHVAQITSLRERMAWK